LHFSNGIGVEQGIGVSWNSSSPKLLTIIHKVGQAHKVSALSDAGYEEALKVAKQRGIEMPRGK
jgi:hypothetical protein